MKLPMRSHLSSGWMTLAFRAVGMVALSVASFLAARRMARE